MLCFGWLRGWYQIEKGRALNENEIGFVVELVMEWIRDQYG